MKVFFRDILLILTFCIFSDVLIAQDKNHTDSGNSPDEINEYGGITIETINDDLIEDNEWIKMTKYYDNNNNLVKLVVTFSTIVTKETGLIEQIEYYDGDVINKYEMLFSEEFMKLHDFNRAIEFVGENRIILRTIWLVNDTVIDIVDHPQSMNSFQFYNIDFIKNELLVYYEPNTEMDSSVISGKYVTIRSLIKFHTDLVELTENDYNILRRFTTFYDIGITPSFITSYRKKVRVYYEDNYYWFFVHSQFERHINGQFATIRYIPHLWNGELYLLGIGLYSLN